MKKRFTKESARRALRTFWETAAAYVLINIKVVDFSSGKEVLKSGLIGLGVAALAAGLAAAANLEKEIDEEGWDDYGD